MSPDLSSSRMKVHQDSQLLSVGSVFDQRLFQLFRYVLNDQVFLHQWTFLSPLMTLRCLRLICATINWAQ